MTSLWLNKRELQYIECVMRDDMEEYPGGDEILTPEKRDKLYDKVIALKKQNGTTDENGTATLKLYDAMLYNVTIVCDTGKASAFKIYPHESEYNIFVDC